jgi:hypothetical protein
MIRISIRCPLTPQDSLDDYLRARRCADAVRECGGVLDGYYVPEPASGPPRTAFALVAFANVSAYDQYRAVLARISRAETSDDACVVAPRAELSTR